MCFDQHSSDRLATCSLDGGLAVAMLDVNETVVLCGHESRVNECAFVPSSRGPTRCARLEIHVCAIREVAQVVGILLSRPNCPVVELGNPGLRPSILRQLAPGGAGLN